jgi:hypothetical protein
MDVEAPIILLDSSSSELLVEVKLQINEGEEIMTNSITVTYFSLEVNGITVQCSCEAPSSTSFSLD